MASPFEQVILRLGELGFFKFLLPFFLTSAIFYGLLRKSKVFGEPDKNIVVNAIVALTAGFMVWAYPILVGVDIQTQFSTFILQSTLAMFAIVVALLIAGMFFPEDLPKKFADTFKTGRGMAVVIMGGLLIVFSLLFSSGLINILFPGGFFGGAGGFNISFGGFDSTTMLSAVTIIAMGLAVMGIVWGGPGKKS